MWPGTFALAEFINAHRNRYSREDVLELGSATGALSIFFKKSFPEVRLCTSDIDDGGDVEANIRYNFIRNGLECVPHVAHTWGNSWENDAQSINPYNFNFRRIIASDILLYVR